MPTEPESSASSMSEIMHSPSSASPLAQIPTHEPQQSPANSNASNATDPTTPAPSVPRSQPPQIVFRAFVPPPTSTHPLASDAPDTSELVKDLRNSDGSRRELTPYYRGILVGLRLGGLTLDKISRMTGIPKGTIHACVKRDAERPGYQGESGKKTGRPRKAVEGQDGEEEGGGEKKRRKVQTVKPPGTTLVNTATPGQPPAQKNGATPKTGLARGASISAGAGRRGGVRKVIPGELNLVVEHPEVRMRQSPIEERLFTELSRENTQNDDTPVPEVGTS